MQLFNTIFYLFIEQYFRIASGCRGVIFWYPMLFYSDSCRTNLSRKGGLRGAGMEWRVVVHYFILINIGGKNWNWEYFHRNAKHLIYPSVHVTLCLFLFLGRQEINLKDAVQATSHRDSKLSRRAHISIFKSDNVLTFQCVH